MRRLYILRIARRTGLCKDFSATIPHAVTSVNRVSLTDSFTYDANGNMTCRVESGITYLQTYNAENRLSNIQKLASGTCAAPGSLSAKWDFAYDGDGVRTSQLYTPYTNGQPQTSVLTSYYFGGSYEVTDSSVKKYYAFAGMTIAMRDATGLKYFLTDHLGSVVAVLSSSGTLTSQQRYLPFGQVRTDLNGPRITQTDFGYTGQRNLDAQGNASLGSMDYKARFHSPYINRFLHRIESRLPKSAFNDTGSVCGLHINIAHPFSRSQQVRNA